MDAALIEQMLEVKVIVGVYLLVSRSLDCLLEIVGQKRSDFAVAETHLLKHHFKKSARFDLLFLLVLEFKMISLTLLHCFDC